MKEIILKLLSVFEDENGGLSSMRVMSVGGVGIFMLTWAIISIAQKQLLMFKPMDVAVLGAFITGKFAQKFPEVKEAIGKAE